MGPHYCIGGQPAHHADRALSAANGSLTSLSSPAGAKSPPRSHGGLVSVLHARIKNIPPGLDLRRNGKTMTENLKLHPQLHDQNVLGDICSGRF